MAKILHGKTTITIENQYTGREVYETTSVSISSLDGGKTYALGAGKATYAPTSCAVVGSHSKTAQEPEDPRKKLIESHTRVLTDVLKQIETSRLNAAIRRERLEEELAGQERANLVTLRFGVFGAIQAGLASDEVTGRMGDGWADLVTEAFTRVYNDTDLHTAAGGC